MDLFGEFTKRHDKSRPLPSAGPSTRSGGSHTSTSISRPAEPAAANRPGQSPARSDPCRSPLPRRTSREPLSIAIPEPGRRPCWSPFSSYLVGLRRHLAVDDLPHRGPRRIEPAGPLQGPLAVRLQAPGARGNTRADRRRRPPAPGRHPRGHARPADATSTRPWSTRPSSSRTRSSRPASSASWSPRSASRCPREPTWPTRRDIAASCRKVLTPGPLPDQQIRLRRQDRRRRRLRRARHPGQAPGRATRP